MLETHFSFLKTAFCFFTLNLFFLPTLGFSSVVDETLKGDEKLVEGQIDDAEKHYATALKMDPDNWRIMRSLAEVRFRLKNIEKLNSWSTKFWP